MRNATNLFFLATVLSLALNGCGLSPSPTVTAVVLTTTSIPQTLTPVLYTPTLTPIPKGITIVVTTTADSGLGTLRQALRDAKPGDTITFDQKVFPPENPAIIFLNTEDQDSALPNITQGGISIDASNAGVILDGRNISGDWVNGLEIYSDGNAIQGLQIVNFSASGIVICGGSHNLIGGDPNMGSGLLGQGNLVNKNTIGIDLCENNTSFNIMAGNMIGTDLSGAVNLGNKYAGIIIEKGPSKNTIGPKNIIAYNSDGGIAIASSGDGNTILQNSIHDNLGAGIKPMLFTGGNTGWVSPIINDFDLNGGTVAGTACANCIVEVFSDSNNEGKIFEGNITADKTGFFTYSKGAPLVGPWLTITATDNNGNTSQFSNPVSMALILQEGNSLPRQILQPKQSGELEDNRIGTMSSTLMSLEPEIFPDKTLEPSNIHNLGFKRFRFTLNGMETPSIDWDKPEFVIEPSHDEFITKLANNGFLITYVLSFWDTDRVALGGELEYPRFKTEEEIERYLEYVKFIVHHFKDRIEYYEIWNEPNCPYPDCIPQQIEAEDYIKLVERVVPVIRQEYPGAKIVVGGTTSLIDTDSQAYLFKILRSKIMPLVNVISWHPMYGSSPEYDLHRQYYYGYPSLVQKIKDTASSNGFKGEFVADEIHWPTLAQPEPPWPTYSETQSVKYLIRSIVMHLGMDVSVTQILSVKCPQMYLANQCLSTTMAGASPTSLPIKIQSTAKNIKHYSFSLTNGDQLIALWSDGIASDYDLGVKSTLIIPGFSVQKATSIDVLNGFEQDLITTSANGELIIRDFLIKDYPIIIRLSK